MRRNENISAVTRSRASLYYQTAFDVNRTNSAAFIAKLQPGVVGEMRAEIRNLFCRCMKSCFTDITRAITVSKNRYEKLLYYGKTWKILEILFVYRHELESTGYLF